MRAGSWRLLLDAPAVGAWNMAVDEALLEARAAGRSQYAVTLRLYGWRTATLSLGRCQPAAGVAEPHRLRDREIDLVRRPTGGLAVLHEHERTYAVCGPLHRAPFPQGVLDTYRRLSEALESALRRLGVEAHAVPGRGATATQSDGAADPSCFASTSAHEISVGGRKLVGSAQLRRHGGFLQHGSILLHADAERLAGVLGGSAASQHFTDLATVLGREPEPRQLDQALVEAMQERFDVRLEPGRLSAWELQRATELYTWKYLSLAWTLEGQPGRREQRWGPVI